MTDFRVIKNQNKKMPDQTRFYKDEFDWVFHFVKENGDGAGISHDSASINFSTDGESLSVTKTATVNGNKATFSFSSSDFPAADTYTYQMKISDGTDYVAAYGILYLKPFIE